MIPDVGRHPERERQQQGDARDGADAGQRADERAEDHAGHGHDEVERRERDREAEGEVGEEVHRGSEPQHAGRERHLQPPGEDGPVRRRRWRRRCRAPPATSALPAAGRIPTRNSTVPTAMPSHGMSDDEQPRCRRGRPGSARAPAAARQPGRPRLGLADGAARAGARPARPWRAPSQNGKKPEPGPVGAPVRVVPQRDRREARRRTAAGGPRRRGRLVARGLYFFSAPRSPSAFSYLALRPSRYLLASSPVHCTA